MSDPDPALVVPQSRFFTVPDPPADGGGHATVRLHALEWPSAAPRVLVFLHGRAAHAHWWDHVAPAFLDTHRVLALDLRGHGESEHTPGRYGRGAFAHDVRAVLDALGGPVDVVGASMGGRVAIQAVADHSRVGRLVLVDVPAHRPRNVPRFRGLLGTPRPYASRAEALRRFRLMPPGTTAAPELLARIAEHSIRPLEDGHWTVKFDRRMFRDPPAHTADDIFAHIPCPTLIVRGEHSPILPVAGAAMLLARLPDARLVTIPGAYHHVFLDDPEAFVAAVRTFLAGGGA